MSDMNKQDYIAKVKRALRHVDRKTKKLVTSDIQSYIEDSIDTDESLTKRFGTPEELVAQYLGDMNAKPSIAVVIQSFMRRGIFVAGVITLIALVVIIALGWGLWKFLDRDSFDLSDETAQQLDTTHSGWNNQPYHGEMIMLEVQQGDMALYWHDEERIAWRCKGRPNNNTLTTSQDHITFSMRHSRCWLFLPRQSVDVRSIQARVTLVQPLAHVSIDVLQTHVRIAEKGHAYNYHLNLEESNFTPLISHADENVTIKITAFHSEIEPYIYR